MIFLAVLGFFLGLAGFKQIVALVYPVKGYIDLIVILLLVFNFIKVITGEKKRRL